MRSFAELQARAELRKGGAASLEADLPVAKTAQQLAAIGDDRYLSCMSLRIFQAGLNHAVIAAKWSAFEQVFHQFDPYFCAMLSDDFVEGCMQNQALIRHLGKLRSIRGNAQMVRSVAQEHGSFGQFIAAWPATDIVGLWAYLKQHGTQLGGMSGARFLRMVGKDTFLLTEDVVAVLKSEGVIAKSPTSAKELRAVQAVFNQWQVESGRPLCEISRILSMVV